MENRAAALPTTRGDGKPLRVLIVDDDPAIRMLCSINLRLEGLDVLEARRLDAALTMSTRPDLVLSDVMLPGLDGFQFAEALRRDECTSGVPLIFLSAAAGTANEARAHALVALAYLIKPFDPTALAAMVAGVLAGSVTAVAGTD